MEMKEQNQQIFLQTLNPGCPSLFATTEIKTAIISLHQEEAKQERKGEAEVMIDPKYRTSYAGKYY